MAPSAIQMNAMQDLPFAPDIEDEANANFQKIYNQPPNNITIDEVLEMLKQFKDSSIKRERVSPSYPFSDSLIGMPVNVALLLM